jgi:hypothetical protein
MRRNYSALPLRARKIIWARTEFSTRRKWRLTIFLLLRRCLYKEFIGFFFGRNQALRESAAIVLRHTILPLQKISDTLRFDPHLDPPQAGEEQIHLVLKTLFQFSSISTDPARSLSADDATVDVSCHRRCPGVADHGVRTVEQFPTSSDFAAMIGYKDGRFVCRDCAHTACPGVEYRCTCRGCLQSPTLH